MRIFQNMVTKFAVSNVSDQVTVQNWLLFSITEITYDGRTRTIGIGGFGQVRIFPQAVKKLKEV